MQRGVDTCHSFVTGGAWCAWCVWTCLYPLTPATAASLDDAVCWLTFTNVAGVTIHDESGHDNHGTLGAAASVSPNGGPTLPNGTTLAAVELDGSESIANSVIIADSASLDFDKTEGSIAFWTNPDVLPTRATFVKSDPYASTTGIEVEKNTYGLFGSPSGWNYAFYAGGYPAAFSPPPGNWTHVVYTWNAATDTCQFYINGALRADSNWGTGSSFSPTTTGTWYLGWDKSVNTRPLDGRLADFAIFTNILSATEVFNVYSNGVAGISGESPPPPPLEALLLQVL